MREMRMPIGGHALAYSPARRKQEFMKTIPADTFGGETVSVRDLFAGMCETITRLRPELPDPTTP
jgi:hypothetical protein